MGCDRPLARTAADRHPQQLNPDARAPQPSQRGEISTALAHMRHNVPPAVASVLLYPARREGVYGRLAKLGKASPISSKRRTPPPLEQARYTCKGRLPLTTNS